MISGALRVAVLVLGAVSAVLGFTQQIKTILGSVPAVTAAHVEPGNDAACLKREMIARLRSEAARPVVAYLTDRFETAAAVPEFFYAAQYGFAPYVLRPDRENADYTLLDFESPEKLARAVSERRLSVIGRSGTLVLAERV